MLLRVAQSASRFPLHIVAIYTSTGTTACEDTIILFSTLKSSLLLFFSSSLLLVFSSSLLFLCTPHRFYPFLTRPFLTSFSFSFPHPSTQLLYFSLAVVECQRAGLKSSAYNYAVMLMSPDYRQHIEASIKKKIEAVVRRKSQQEEEASEELSMCPISKYALHLISMNSLLNEGS